jgi:hypothetical protein
MTETTHPEPATIAIVIATDSQVTLQPVLQHLERLDGIERLEVVIVIPSGEPVELLESSALPNLKIVRISSIYPLASARVAGVRAATAAYVFMGETHSFPRTGMFDAIVRAHEGGAIVAVPVFENENPGELLSWAGFINGYAPWGTWREHGRITHAPLFNASYVRRFLLDMADELEYALTAGGDMMDRLADAGAFMTVDPSARVGHANITSLGHWLIQRAAAGRVIASTRSATWSRARRLAFAGAAPLIPAVLLRRHRSSIMKTMRRDRVSLMVLPVLAFGMLMQAAGEFLGYAFGPSESFGRMYDRYEIRQLSYTRCS